MKVAKATFREIKRAANAQVRLNVERSALPKEQQALVHEYVQAHFGRARD